MKQPYCASCASILLTLAVPCSGGEVESPDHDHDESSHEAHSQTETLGLDLTKGWFDPWQHGHRSRSGAPFVHPFGFEPAYLGRDVLPSYRFGKFEEGEEHEIELEVEWAFTRRLGIVLEQAYVFDRPGDEAGSDGWADFAFVPTALIAEYDRFLASLAVEVVAPTGSSRVGAGEEWRIAPFTSMWFALGNWWSLTSALGVEFALDSSETELFFGVGLNKAIQLSRSAEPDLPHSDCLHHGHIHHHDATGLLFLTAEVLGSGVIDGEPEEEGIVGLDALLGATYSVSSNVDVRGFFEFPLNAHSDLEWAAGAGLLFHF